MLRNVQSKQGFVYVMQEAAGSFLEESILTDAEKEAPTAMPTSSLAILALQTSEGLNVSLKLQTPTSKAFELERFIEDP